MQIYIDYREKDLYEKLIQIKKKDNIHIVIKNLDIGDIIISDQHNKELVIIERKTLKDLASSILDGRYKEQSYRLNNCEIPNHNIIYLIEGNITSYVPNTFGRSISKESLYSSFVSILYSKGFSIYKSFNLVESAEFIIQMAIKLDKIKHQPFLPEKSSTLTNYVEVCNRVKKTNVTTENILAIMLSQIPGVSSISATAISNKFVNLDNLITCIKNDPDALKDIFTVSRDGKQRKLNITCRQNINKYLLNNINNINI